MNQRFDRHRALLLGTLVSPISSLAACGDVQDEDVTQSTAQHVIYGADSRTDVYAAADRNLAALARRTSVAQFRRTAVDQSDPNNVKFIGERLGDRIFETSTGQSGKLCSNEQFVSEFSPAACSATLIAEDLVLVAGHCLSSHPCADSQFVFGYYKDSETTNHVVTSDDVYNCQAVVDGKYVPGTRGVDYAVVRLDRKAGKRYATPAIDTADSVAINTFVGGAGVPLGISTKVFDGAWVRSLSPGSGFFTSNADTTNRNSGSGVYDTADYKLKGVHVRGDDNRYTFDAAGNCLRERHCADGGCVGQDEVYVSRAIAGLCSKEPGHPLCGPQDRVSFTGEATSSATQNTRNQWLYVPAGQHLQVSSCSGAGSHSGDTFFRLFDNEGVQVTEDDDACGYAAGSKIQFTASESGLYELRAGCYNERVCSGTAQWTLSDAYLEAECPTTARGAYASSQSQLADHSGAGYLTSAGGATLASKSTDFATYTVKVAAGAFKLYFRSHSDGSIYRDSWFWRVDGGPWVTENNRSSNGFVWFEGSSQLTLNGQHVIEIANREAGWHLDKLAVLPADAPVPQGQGGVATNCGG